MNKIQMLFAETTVIILVVIVLIIGVLGVIGYLYLKSTPVVGDYDYATYNDTKEVDISNSAATPTPTATPTASPIASPSASALASVSASPSPTPSPTPVVNCVAYEGKSSPGDRVCAGKDTDPVKRHIWECQNGTWVLIDSCESASACTTSGCS